VKIPALQRPPTSNQIPGIFSWPSGRVFSVLVAMLLLFLTGCSQDNSGLHEENIKLKKQIAKLESVIHSLQEGNRIMQQQINLLNQEARKTAESYEEQLRDAEATHLEQLRDAQAKMTELVNGPKKDVARIKTLEQENRKLEGETKWLRSQRDQIRKALTLHQIGGQTMELPFSFSSVSKIIEEALTKNGYSILSSMQTDQQAIYITDRKTSLPPSLELPGFRNQYLLSIEKGPSDHAIVWVRAEFEKLSKNGQMFSAPQSEITEIELRLIQEIHQVLSNGAAAQAKNF
jgi:cell division protein FtsB